MRVSSTLRRFIMFEPSPPNMVSEPSDSVPYLLAVCCRCSGENNLGVRSKHHPIISQSLAYKVVSVAGA